MYNILIKHNDSKTLWQLYGTTTSAASNTETFTPFEEDNLENLNLINDLIKNEITINLPDQTSISFLGNKSDLLYLPKEKNNE